MNTLLSQQHAHQITQFMAEVMANNLSIDGLSENFFLFERVLVE